MALFLACMVTVNPTFGKPPGVFLGTFDIGKNPLLPTKENLLAASADVARSGCKKTIRVLALVDPSFSPAALAPAGWRLVSQVKDVASLEGCERTEPYLTAIPGILSVEHRTRIFTSMDSVRSQSHINEVLGTVSSPLSRHFTGKGVIFGIIDAGFEPHHPAFLDSLGHTRFLGLWDQTDNTNNKNRFGYGRIRWQQEIDSNTSYITQDPAHGTHTASAGAGSDKTHPYYGAAPDATILAVTYGSDSGTTADVVNGLNWIFSVADSLKMPCVVNMSIGLQEGPHDGSSLVDRTVDALSGAGHIVVGAAGNDGATKAHIAFSLAADETKGTLVGATYVSDSISADSAKWLGYSLIDMWGEPNIPFSDTLYILTNGTGSYKKSGTALTTNIRTASQQTEDRLLWPDAAKGPDTLIIQTFVEKANALNNKPHMEIFVFTTNWSYIPGVRVTSNAACTIHAWNCYKMGLVGDNLPGFQDGDTTITINEVGSTANSIISVGSYFSKTVVTSWNGTVTGTDDTTLNMWAPWSSIGPTVDGRIKPDICAGGRCLTSAASSTPDEDPTRVVVWPNPANNYGRYAWSQGTSLSAPVVAGIVALMLEADPTLTASSALQILQQTATKDKFTGPLTTPDVRWGAGKVNALGALEAMGIPVALRHAPLSPSRTQPVLLKRKGWNILTLQGFAGAMPRKVFVELFNVQGRLLASIPVSADGIARVPEHVAQGCFIARAQWLGGKTEEQLFSGL